MMTSLSDITFMEAGVAMGIVTPVSYITWRAATVANRLMATMASLEHAIREKIDYDEVVHWIVRMRDLNPDLDIPYIPEKRKT
jgi:hypothetical protein